MTDEPGTQEDSLSDAEAAAFAQRMNGWLGTILMVLGSILAVLIFCDRAEMHLFDMPVFWHQMRPFHLLVCLMIFGGAAAMLKTPRPEAVAARRMTIQSPFSRVRFYTRQGCHLCDETLSILREEASLPEIEIIDIDSNDQLQRQFGESVPVIEIDGRIRFRGGVQPLALRRLIEGTLAQQSRS